MLKVLRPTRHSELISANVFDQIFKDNLGSVLDISLTDTKEWFDTILGPLNSYYSFEDSAKKFSEATANFDFFCPSFECFPSTPYFLTLRNFSKSNVRLLFIAHSPAMYIMEWIMLSKILCPGDTIIAPSDSAKRVIDFLCPELSDYVEVIPHPIHALPHPVGQTFSSYDRLVSLSSVVETKLIHKQIEAMSLLKKRGHHNLRMDIGGSLNPNSSDDPTQYALTLKAMIERLGLQDSVVLAGPIIGDDAKAAFLSGAKVSINLSNSLEEACPKAPVEALSMGIPVVTTYWNGYTEAVGKSGILLPLEEDQFGNIDIPVELIADAIESLLDNSPSKEECMNHAERYAPDLISERYRTVLENRRNMNSAEVAENVDILKSNDLSCNWKGFVGDIGIVNNFTWKELFSIHSDFVRQQHLYISGSKPQDSCREEIIRDLIIYASKKPLESFYGYKSLDKWYTDDMRNLEHVSHQDQFIHKLMLSLLNAPLITSRVAALYYVSSQKEPEYFDKVLSSLNINALPPGTGHLYRSKLFYAKKQYSKALDSIQKVNLNQLKEYNTPFLRQYIKVCRGLKTYNEPVVILKQWLSKYPDGCYSGPIWLDLAVILSDSGNYSEAGVNIKRAESLLGNIPVIQKVKEKIANDILFESSS